MLVAKPDLNLVQASLTQFALWRIRAADPQQALSDSESLKRNVTLSYETKPSDGAAVSLSVLQITQIFLTHKQLAGRKREKGVHMGGQGEMPLVYARHLPCSVTA